MITGDNLVSPAGAGTTCVRSSSALTIISWVKSEHHGVDGEWRVERPGVSWDVLDSVAKAAVEMGIPMTPDFNTGDNTRRWLLPRQSEAWLALVVGAWLPEASAASRQLAS